MSAERIVEAFGSNHIKYVSVINEIVKNIRGV